MRREDSPGREARHLRVLRVAAHHHRRGQAAGESAGVHPRRGARRRGGRGGFFRERWRELRRLRVEGEGLRRGAERGLGLLLASGGGGARRRRRRRLRFGGRRHRAWRRRRSRALVLPVRERAHALGHLGRSPRGFVGKHGAALPCGVRTSCGGAGSDHGAVQVLLVVIHRHALAALLLHVDVGGDAALDLARDARRLRLGDAPRALVDGGGVQRLVEGRVHAEHGLVRGELVPLRGGGGAAAPAPPAALRLHGGILEQAAAVLDAAERLLARRGRPRDELALAVLAASDAAVGEPVGTAAGANGEVRHAHVARFERDEVGEGDAHGGRGGRTLRPSRARRLELRHSQLDDEVVLLPLRAKGVVMGFRWDGFASTRGLPVSFFSEQTTRKRKTRRFSSRRWSRSRREGTGEGGEGGVRAYLGVGRGGGVEHALVDIAGLELRAFRGEASDGVWIGASGFLPARARKEKRCDRDDFSRDRARVRARDARRTVTSTWYPTSTSATNARRSRPWARPAGGMVSRLRATRIEVA